MDVDPDLLAKMLEPGFKRASPIQQALMAGAHSLEEREDKLPNRSHGRKLLGMASAIRPQYKWYPFHEEIAEALELLQQRKIKRLAIFMPPQHAKSTLASRMFPAYSLGMDGNEKIIHASYASDLSESMGKDVMQYMSTPAYMSMYSTRLASGMPVYVNRQQRMRVRKIKETNARFEVANGEGFMMCTGVGGGQTGFSSSMAIIDDPIKNREEANSPRISKRNWGWYTSSILTREAVLSDMDQVLLLCQTLWTENGIAGRTLRLSHDMEDDGWVVLRFPAIKETSQPKVFAATPKYCRDLRKPGEPLLPNQMKKYMEIKRTSPQDWNALYQQRPSPEEGGMFLRSWWQRYEPTDLKVLVERKQIKHRAFSVDCAFKEKSGRPEEGPMGSRVAVGLWATTGAQFYLERAWVGWYGWLDTKRLCKSLFREYPEVRAKYIEEKGNGSALIQELKEEFSGIVPINPTESKETRALAINSLVEAGNVWLPRFSNEAELLIEEAAVFPYGATDDLVDMMTQYLNKVHQSGLNWLKGMVQQ